MVVVKNFLTLSLIRRLYHLLENPCIKDFLEEAKTYSVAAEYYHAND